MNQRKSISTARIRQIVSLIDLTNLNDQCDNQAIESICSQAETPVGSVAAICIWPSFVHYAKTLLGSESSVKIATVVNFPAGNESLKTTCNTIDRALTDGAGEIDYVLPYTELINNKFEKVAGEIKAVRECIPGDACLKVILETGLLSPSLIHTAAKTAIEQGADFIKTSTGKVPVNATLEAAKIMLDAIVDTPLDVGFKAAGGISTTEEADLYLKLAEERCGSHWADPDHFRIGASSLLDDALLKLNIDSSTPSDANGNY
jgi:deoxyribose-phosphate aldolase